MFPVFFLYTTNVKILVFLQRILSNYFVKIIKIKKFTTETRRHEERTY